MKNKLPIPKLMELIFDSLYLVIAVGFGIYYLFVGNNDLKTLWGIMALTLAIGDSFHLIPRMAAALTGNTEKYQKSMGVGKMLTSITMTLFYVLLWEIGLMIFDFDIANHSIGVYILAGIRIILCLFPQNQWKSKTPSIKWGIYRNIPFLLEGIMVWIIFAMGDSSYGFGSIAIAILLSFAFYIPVVLWVHKNPKIGMLMLPKTMAYVWIIIMGLKLV